MPELPEVETVRRSIERVVVGRRVERVRIQRVDVVEGARTAWALLEGGVVESARRRGKRLAIVCEDGRALDVHLGMSGMVLLGGGEEGVALSTHVHVVWTLGRDARGAHGEDGGCVMALRDPRRFGGVRTFESFDALRDTVWSRLGPDAATVSAADLGAGLASTTRCVKSALLDQAVIAGVGNIYADESLFGAGVHPMRESCSLRDDDVARLASAVRAVLARAIEAGGSTVRDYARPDGDRGWFQLEHAVYGRAGDPCSRCGRALMSGVVGGRTTVWCGLCQPRRGGKRGKRADAAGLLSTIPTHGV